MLPVFSRATYTDRRNRLKSRLKSGILLFMGNDESPMNYGDNCYPFRQDSSFLYFFGIDRPGLSAVIDLDKDQEIIFGDDLSIHDVVWTGPQPSVADLAELAGVGLTKTSGELPGFLAASGSSGNEIHFLPPYRSSNLLKISGWLDIAPIQVKSGSSPDFIREVIVLRSHKSDEEVQEMTRAVNISRELHSMANEMCRTGITESKINGVLHEIVIGHGGQFAYPPIITINGQTLHNHSYCNTLEKGRMLLVDAGAEVASHYAGDITRTFPVDGKFTEQQREVYSIVLRTQSNAINNCTPGAPFVEVHRRAMVDLVSGLKDLGLMKGDVHDAVAEGAHALFCPHGLGHMLGLDVHDMEDLGEDAVGYGDAKRSDLLGLRSLRLGRALEPGFVVTVEPGAYFIPELIDRWKSESKLKDFIDYSEVEKYVHCGGIRIEDNVLITDDGRQVLGKPIPKLLVEIES